MLGYLADGAECRAIALYQPSLPALYKGGKGLEGYAKGGELVDARGEGYAPRKGDYQDDVAEQLFERAGTNPFADNPQEKAEGGKLGKYWEGLKKGWDYTTDAVGRGAKAVGRGIESGIGYVGATYKADSAKRAQDLSETSRILGEARDAYLAGVLKTKAEMQTYANQIDEITPGAVDLFTGWL